VASGFKFESEVCMANAEMLGNLGFFLLGDALLNGFVHFRILPRETSLRKLAFNSRNCSSGIPTITLPSGLPEASSYGRAAACNIRAKTKQRWLDFGY
jgi:hypothetical protein